MLLPSEIFSHRHYLCLAHARLPENFWWFVLVLGFGGLSCFLVHRRWPIYFCSLVSSLLLSNLSGRNEGECLLFVTRNSFYSLFLYSFKKYFWLCWVFIVAWVAASGGYFLVVVHGLLIEVASLVAEHGL